MPRLCLLGLDAGDFDYIQSRASALPCLQEKLKSGNLVKLDVPKALSGSVWPTFYNGADPGVHGMYQHLVWDAKRMGLRRIGADWSFYHPFWQDIENAGHHVVILDVPYSFPVALNKGLEITDWATHGQTYPLGCSQERVKAIIQDMGNSPIGRETPIQKTSGELKTIQQQLIASAELKSRLIIELMQKVEWDLFVAVFAETHRGGHVFFSNEDEKAFGPDTPLLKIYQAVDRALARIFGHVDDETTVVVFSAHGMTRDYAQGHIVRPLMKRINEIFLEKYCGVSPKRTFRMNGLVPYLRNVVPARLQYAIGASSPDFVRQWVVEKEIIGGLDWSLTPGFALRTDIRTELRLNLIGRESQGMLAPHSELHNHYVAFLKNVFLELRDRDTNVHLVDEVVDTQEIFSGDRSGLLPDYVITWNARPFVKRVYSPLVGELTFAQLPGARGGDHTDYGFAIIPDSVRDLHPLHHIKDLAGWSKRFVNMDG
ncbi:alkaline phosphatase family protein [Nitrospira sp. Ecomares 2.1]